MSTYTCPSCDRNCDPSLRACPNCGAAVDVRLATTEGGWTEVPGIRDLAHLQFGQSTIQISGAYVPVADVNLAAGDMVYFSHHVVLWKDPQVKLHGSSLGGAWKRWLAGLPLVLTEATGPGHVAFSVDAPGETIAIPLDAGQSVEVREGTFMLATDEVDYAWIDSYVWYRTGSRHYPAGRYLDRFTARDRGLLLLHAAGNVFVRHLHPGESILIKPSAFLYKDPGVKMELYIEHPRNYNRVWQRRYIWLKMYGSGRVAIHSAFPRWEDPPEPVEYSSFGTRIVDW